MAANGVSSPTKPPMRRKTASAGSSSAAGAPSATSRWMDGDTHTSAPRTA